VVPDILWPQLRRTAKILFDRLNAAGFEVFDYNYWTDEQDCCIIIFEFTVYSLPEVEKVQGPEIQYAKGVEDFIGKHRHALSGPWIGGNRIFSAKKRRFTSASELIGHIAKHPSEFAIPAKISEHITRYKRLRTPSLLKPKYAPFLYDYLYKKHYYIDSY